MEEIAIPESLDEALRWLTSTMSDDDRLYILNISDPDEFVGINHLTHARSIRSDWGLWTEGPLRDWFKKHGINHADDMSSVIFEALWYKVHGKKYDIGVSKARFDAHWEKYGDLGDV